MAQIPGRLLADLHPNGTVRVVFVATVGGGNETGQFAFGAQCRTQALYNCGGW